jgi:thiol:disulfide interchange protein DsbD
LNWRAPAAEADGGATPRNAAGGIAWQPWSAEAVSAARAARRPVLVDFTADWCASCQVNRKFSIEVPSVREKLKALNVVTLEGDYTQFPDAITRELRRFHSAGVPLVLVYPKGADTQPIMLPALLTPGIVKAALDRAAQ